MAASKTIDPSTTTTAADAFKHPLPQIRQFHRDLTSELDAKNARLRTLVGGSYRQLLDTAEMILDMKKDIGSVEERLATVGERCGRGAVGEKVKGLGTLYSERSGEEMEWAARMKVLSTCGLVAGRLLRKGGDSDSDGNGNGGRNGSSNGGTLLLAAKVWVLSRLLAKSVGELATRRRPSDQAMAKEARRKVEIQKTRLLRAIERKVENIRSAENRADILQALAAYSLAESSSAKDVLKYFLRMRGKAIAIAFEDDEDQKRDNSGVLKALELYARTLLDVQALVPRRLSETLAELKTKALLKDDAIRELEGLRLDVCEKWFGDGILYFTPYIRHDDLEGSQVVDTLMEWAEKGSKVLLQGLSKALERTTDFKGVVETRTKVLEIWLKQGGRAKGFDASVLLDGLRKVFNDRMLQLLESRVAKLHLITTEIEATLGSWSTGVSAKRQSLWDDDMLETEISNGAHLFKQGILARTYGRNDAVSRVYKGYETWRRLVDENVTVIDQLRKNRWDDDLEDIEDDVSLESRNALLSQEDPKMLQDHLDLSLTKTYQELENKLGALLATYKDHEHNGQIAMYTLRVLRDIRASLPKTASLRSFGLSLVPSLHQSLASTVIREPAEAFLETLNKKRMPGRALWEGSPELPIQITPGTFQFLLSLSLAMAQAGGDLWSAKAVQVLKRCLRAELGREWLSILADQEEKLNQASESTNGSTSKDEAESGDGENEEEKETLLRQRKEYLIQTLFDLTVFQSVLEIPNSEDDLATLQKELESKADLEAGSRKRIQQSAKEHWKRTSLLFGLLA